MGENELKRRTRRFALDVLKLTSQLPRTVEGNTVRGQLARAGTSVGANYRAACRGRSKAEFAAKIGIVEEEADESAFWLEVITETRMLSGHIVAELLREANEITAIMAASRKTARGNQD